MTKKELITELAKRTELPQKKIDLVLGELVSIIQKGLKEGETIRLAGLGTFKTVERKERKGRNPQTGEEIVIPARKVVKFLPAKELKAL